MVALFFAVYTAIQRTRIVPAALRAIQHIHLVYSTYSIQPYSLYSHTAPYTYPLSLNRVDKAPAVRCLTRFSVGLS